MPNQAEKLCQTRHRISDRGDVTDGCAEQPKHTAARQRGHHQPLLLGLVSFASGHHGRTRHRHTNNVSTPLQIYLGDLYVLLSPG